MLELAFSTEATEALRQRLAISTHVMVSNIDLPSERIYMAALKTAAKTAESSQFCYRNSYRSQYRGCS